MPELCVVYHLGIVSYRKAWRLQELLAAQVAAGEHPPALLLLQHPHTITFGRRGHAENLLWDASELERRGVDVVWADRGGDVTYHGPGQLVGYPILPLAPGGLYAGTRPGQGTAAGTLPMVGASEEADETASSQKNEPAGGHESVQVPSLPKADYIGYLRRLEEAVILALFNLGLVAGQIEGLTGVWVQPDVLSRCRNCAPELTRQPAKIAAIGVKVDARGVTRHGFALNVDPDMSYWDAIIGCGLAGYGVTSLAELLQPLPDLERVERAVMAAFGQVFGYQMDERPPAEDFTER